MAQQDNVTVLRIQLDEGKTQEQLQKLVLDIEATRKAQAALTAERKAGTKSDEDFAAESVKLQQQLASQRQEYSGLNKTLDLYQKSMQDNYAGVQSALSLANIQFQQTAGSQDLSTTSAKALSATIADLRGQLTKTDEANLLFVRSVGNYPKGESLEPLIKQLVLLQEVEKQLPVGSQQAIEAQKQIGFQFGKVNEAAAAAGLAQKDVTNKLADYGERLRPVSADLAKLTIAQDAAAASAGKDSQEYAKIGFAIGAARQEIAKVPPELAKVPTEADKASSSLDKTGNALKEGVTKGLGLFGAQTEKVTGVLGKFKSGTDLVTSGLSALKGGGETGALGIRTFSAALASIGIGVILLALSALVGYFTQTNEGSKLLKQALAGLGAVVTTVSNLIFGAGKSMVEAFKNPKQALDDLLSFLKSQVINRLTSFAVILEGIEKRDFKQVANGILQLNTGITNSIDKVQAYAAGIGKVVVAAADLEKQQQALKKSRAQLEQDEILEKGRVEELIRLSKDRTLSASDRLNKLREAGKLESELSAKSLAQITAELNAIKQRNAAKGLTKTADEIQEERDKQKEYNNTVVERNNTLATIKARQSRFILEEAAELKAATKAAADAAKQRAKDAVLEEQAKNNRLLAEAQKETFAELQLKERAIDLAAKLQLAGEKKTKAQRDEILANAARAKSDLEEAFADKSAEAEKKRLAAQATEAKREYDESTKLLAEYLDRKRARVEQDYAEGRIGENQYQKAINAIEAAGLKAQMVINDDYRQDNAKAIKAAADLEIKEHKRVVAERKKMEEVKQEITQATLDATTNASDLIIQAYGEESAAGQVALTIKKTVALAEIGINLEKQLSANALAAAKIAEEYPYVGPALATAYEIAKDAEAISAAAVSAAKVLGFRQGGVAHGPSHEQGGIQMYHKSGAHMGEFEGGEVILTKGVWDNPLLRPLASALNVMGGGAPLMPRPHMAVGGVGQPLILEQLRGGAPPLNEVAIGRAMADSLRKNPAVNRWVDFEKAESRNRFTDTSSNS